MFDFFSIWQTNVIAYLICIVCFYQFYKLAVKNTHDNTTATIVIQTIAGLSIVLLVPFFSFGIPTDIHIYFLLLLACIFFAVSDRLQTTARKNLPVASYALIEQLVTVFLVIYGFTLFLEPITAGKIIGVLFIISGNIFLYYSGKRIKLNKYIFAGIFAALTAASAVSIDIAIMNHFNLPLFIALTFLIPALFVWVYSKEQPKRILNEYQRNTKYYLLTGISFAFAIFFSLRALQLGELTTIVPIQATSVFLNVIVASIVLKEKKEFQKKIFAAILVVLGVYFTTLNI